MAVAKQADLLESAEHFFDAVFDGAPLTVSRSTGNLVILTERDYEEMEKAKRNAEYITKINRAIKQRIDGTMQEHDLIEVLP